MLSLKLLGLEICYWSFIVHYLNKATIVYCDNISAIYMSHNPINHQRTKYVELDIHFFREKVSLGHFQILHDPFSFQYVDIFTKGLPLLLFTSFIFSLSIRPSPLLTAGRIRKNIM